MNNCGPDSDLCQGDKVVDCRCFCDNCEAHYMECSGCVNCDVDLVDDHQWVEGVDPRWLICILHKGEAMVKAA